MKQFSAQYIFTNCGPPLKRGIITTDDEGTIISVKDTGGLTAERHSLEFFNGIIIPGFVNCHCHLELSHMKGTTVMGNGLGSFIEEVRTKRDIRPENIISSARNADNEMYNEGVVLCADICNTPLTFDTKVKSRIKYYNLIEAFGIDPAKAQKRIDEVLSVSEVSGKMSLPFSITPHGVYSTSLPLLRLIKKAGSSARITSIHFLETDEEKQFLCDHTGSIAISYEKSGLMPSIPETVQSHSDAVLNEITTSGNLILVHNTFADSETISLVQKRGNIFWCLCPNSNLFIEEKLPPVDLLISYGCEIVTGTDSLASNERLSILSELKTLQENFPPVTLEDLIKWATLNGARALGEEDRYGSFEPGKKPGLLLLNDTDLINQRLLDRSFISRLI